MDHRHEIFWASPAPLWARRLENGGSGVFERPARLEFRQDEYVGELARALRAGTAAVADRLVDESDSEAGAEWTSPSEIPPLYQPMHGRYYTVSASLVCRRRGLPDRSVHTVEDERVSAVVRRLQPTTSNGSIDLDDPGTYHEYGWIDDSWVRLGNRMKVDELAPSAVADLDLGDEEEPREKRYPMFPKPYDSDLALERSSSERRVWSALVPATERERFLRASLYAGEVATESSPSGGSNQNGSGGGGTEPDGDSGSRDSLDCDDPFWEENVDPRRNILRAEVLQPLVDLYGFADRHGGESDEVAAKDLAAPLAFAIYDLWRFLDRYVTGVRAWFERTPAGTDPTGSNADFEGDRKVLLEHLFKANLNVRLSAANWLDAARAAMREKDAIQGGDWSALVAAKDVKTVGSLAFNEVKSSIAELLNGTDGPDGSGPWQDGVERTSLYCATAKALKEEQADPEDVSRELAPGLTPRDEDAVFVMRCVYERPRCTPYFEPEVSPPTAPFRLASVMDVQAPARDHSFAMPDVGGPGDLRDSEKGVSVMLSEKLNQQIDRVKGVTMSELEEGEIGEEGPGVALVCRLSIPIISICALILLIIMVNILNFIFWWLPYFMICLPIPDSGD